MTAQVAADLRAAADVLERDGWTQGVFTAEDGCRCVEGALLAAANYDGWRVHVASMAMMERLGVSLISWNDAPGRTADEVVTALRAAADAAEADL